MKHAWFLLIILLGSCIRPDVKERAVKKNSDKKITLGQVISFPVDSATDYISWWSQVIVEQGEEILVRENRKRNNLQVYDLQSGSFIRTIQFPYAGEAGVQMIDFLYCSEDTLFVTQLYQHKVWQFNARGDYIKTYNILPSGCTASGQILRNNKNKYVYDNGVLNLPLLPDINYNQKPEEYCKNPQSISYFLTQDSFSYSNINVPDLYAKAYYPDRDAYRTYNPKAEIFIYSWAYDHNLYLADFRGYIDTIFLKSDYVESSSAFKKNSTKNRGRLIYSKSQYKDIIYDTYRDVYYRIVGLGGDATTQMNIDISNEFLYREFVIMLISNDFQLAYELKLPAQTYFIHDYFVDSRGLWISLNNPENPDFDENNIKFQLIQLHDETK